MLTESGIVFYARNEDFHAVLQYNFITLQVVLAAGVVNVLLQNISIILSRKIF